MKFSFKLTPKAIFPDVGLVKVPGRGGLTAVTIPPAPLVGELLQEEYRVYAVEVRLADSGELVTAIEILSPTDKRPNSQALEAYRRKRLDLRRAEVALLELDYCAPVNACRFVTRCRTRPILSF